MDLGMVSVKVVGPKGEPGVTEKQPSYLPISMEVAQYFNNHLSLSHTHTHTPLPPWLLQWQLPLSPGNHQVL